MSVELKGRTQWFEFFDVATAIATAVDYKNVIKKYRYVINVYEQTHVVKSFLRSVITTCEKLYFELPSQAHSFTRYGVKKVISKYSP